MDAIRPWLCIGKCRETRTEWALAALGIEDVPYLDLDSASLAELLRMWYTWECVASGEMGREAFVRWLCARIVESQP